ncbi:MAG: DUF4013 domain-containing protein [Candidatus Woesearchaeota archaeon]|nr:DUF4013 domain-containing protein [Candidatus Woesearchaeota archaeon]
MTFVTALKRPFTDIKSLILGAVVTIVPIVNIALQGYALSCATKKGNDLPEWSGFGSLWVKGLLALVISVIWSIPLMIVAGLTLGSVVFDLIDNPAGAVDLLGSAVLGTVLSGLVGLLTAYIVPVALLKFANGSFSDAFSFGEIFSKAFTSNWLVGWVLAIVAGAIIGAVGMLLSALLAITIIGPFIVQAIAGFSASVAGWTLLGEAYSAR